MLLLTVTRFSFFESPYNLLNLDLIPCLILVNVCIKLASVKLASVRQSRFRGPVRFQLPPLIFKLRLYDVISYTVFNDLRYRVQVIGALFDWIWITEYDIGDFLIQHRLPQIMEFDPSFSLLYASRYLSILNFK